MNFSNRRKVVQRACQNEKSICDALIRAKGFLARDIWRNSSINLRPLGRQFPTASASANAAAALGGGKFRHAVLIARQLAFFHEKVNKLVQFAGAWRFAATSADENLVASNPIVRVWDRLWGERLIILAATLDLQRPFRRFWTNTPSAYPKRKPSGPKSSWIRDLSKS